LKSIEIHMNAYDVNRDFGGVLEWPTTL
jgi:hypothetical protein